MSERNNRGTSKILFRLEKLYHVLHKGLHKEWLKERKCRCKLGPFS